MPTGSLASRRAICIVAFSALAHASTDALAPVLGGSSHLAHRSTKSLGRPSGLTSRTEGLELVLEE